MSTPIEPCHDRLPFTRRVLATLKRAQRPVTVFELSEAYPDVCAQRIRSALFVLLQTRRVRRLGAGRRAPYVWVTDQGVVQPPPTQPRVLPPIQMSTGFQSLHPRWPRPRGTSLGPPLLGLACA